MNVVSLLFHTSNTQNGLDRNEVNAAEENKVAFRVETLHCEFISILCFKWPQLRSMCRVGKVCSDILSHLLWEA